MAVSLPSFSRREVSLPGIQGKAFAVIGVRRGGKTTFLSQCKADRLAQKRPADSQLLISLEDERLHGMSASDLAWLLEEHSRQFSG
ncbi:MAG: AAA family ATPase, partial [Planctomycetia bacterium]